MADLSFVDTDELLKELAKRYDSMLFVACNEPQSSRISWKWWRGGKSSLYPFLMRVLQRIADKEVNTLIEGNDTETPSTSMVFQKWS